MSRKPHTTSLVLLMVCIFAFWWGISVLTQNSVTSGTMALGNASVSTSIQTATPLVVNEKIEGTTYTFSGIYNTPSPCDSMGSGIRYSPQDGGRVTVLLVTTESSVACAQAADNAGQPFTVSIKMPNGGAPRFSGVALNGAEIASQLVLAN